MQNKAFFMYKYIYFYTAIIYKYMNKILLILIILIITSLQINAQEVTSYKLKTTQNAKERKAILDCYRKQIKKEWAVDVQFEINILDVYKNYAVILCNVSNKTGGQIIFPDNDGLYDCCHAEATFKKVKGRWIIVEHGEFSTDAWWTKWCDGDTKGLPKALFSNVCVAIKSGD